MQVRRETLIALRARRTAHRVASDFINPHLEVPRPEAPYPPPRIDQPQLAAWDQPIINPSPREFFDVLDRETLPRLVLAVVFAAFSAVALYVAAHIR